MRLLDSGYTRLALQSFARLEAADLHGIALREGRRLRTFCLGGDLGHRRTGTGAGACFLVEKSDLTVPGAGILARWHFHRSFTDASRINDAGDLGLPGLARMKRSFRPIERLAVYPAARPGSPDAAARDAGTDHATGRETGGGASARCIPVRDRLAGDATAPVATQSRAECRSKSAAKARSEPRRATSTSGSPLPPRSHVEGSRIPVSPACGRHESPRGQRVSPTTAG